MCRVPLSQQGQWTAQQSYGMLILAKHCQPCWCVEFCGLSSLSLLCVQGHSAEIVSLCFDTTGEKIMTGSFDHTSKVWDVRTGQCAFTLAGHGGNISHNCVQFNYTGDLALTGSIVSASRIRVPQVNTLYRRIVQQRSGT